MTDEKYTQEFQKALNDYIKLGFSQDECSGFMHGFHKGAEAMQKDERIKELEAYVIDTDRILDSGIEIMPESPHHERTKKLKSSI